MWFPKLMHNSYFSADWSFFFFSDEKKPECGQRLDGWWCCCRCRCAHDVFIFKKKMSCNCLPREEAMKESDKLIVLIDRSFEISPQKETGKRKKDLLQWIGDAGASGNHRFFAYHIGAWVPECLIEWLKDFFTFFCLIGSFSGKIWLWGTKIMKAQMEWSGNNAGLRHPRASGTTLFIVWFDSVAFKKRTFSHHEFMLVAYNFSLA